MAEPLAEPSWTPSLLIDLANALAWPAVVLILGVAVGVPLLLALKRLLAKRVIKELNAGASGVNVVLEAEAQVASTELASVTGSYRAGALPENMSLEHIRRVHAEYETPQSVESYNSIMHHVKALALPDREAIELLAKDNALLQQAVFVHIVSKPLFRSQYVLLSERLSEQEPLPIASIKEYFDQVKKKAEDAYEDWDHVRYLAYLVRMRLIEETDAGYKLTKTGASYVRVMQKNLHLVDELSKL